MQQISGIKYENLPKVGYLSLKDERKKKIEKEDTHIHKQGIFSGVGATAHKFVHNFTEYFPKGFAGSKNSDFYEYLSLGMVPYLIGSATMYSLYKVANNFFKLKDRAAANSVAQKMGAGIVLYGLGKLCSRKLAHTLINASTGVDLDMKYKNRIKGLPEPGEEEGKTREQRPGVFDSCTFYRCDLLDKDSELNHDDDKYYYYDKIAKKAGYKKRLNNPHQEMGPKLKELKARTTALENISKYVAAATGVAIGAQKAFGDLKFSKVISKTSGFSNKALVGNIKGIANALVEAPKQLWKGSGHNVLTKYGGKALLIGTVVSTLLTWLIPTKAFKSTPNTMNSKVDTTKEYEVG